MMRGLLLAVLLPILAPAGQAQTDDGLAAGSENRPRAPDYANPSAWACRPGAEDACIAGLDAVAVGRDGQHTLAAFKPAENPPIDCFYVYPTASRQQTDYADLVSDPAVTNVIHAQAGRLASRCQLYVPLYRQATLYHLHHHPGHDWDGPYQDIAAAWAWYMAHDNHGRGVVFIGHSQGTILLQRLVAEQIDGKPAQDRLVSAFLIGNPGLMVPKGQTTRGTFKNLPICTAAEQTGCVWAWASYFEGDDGPRAFGLDKDGLTAACTNPDAPGGTGTLDAYFSQEGFPSVGPEPFMEISGQIAATCRTDAQGSVLRIAILPGANADALQTLLTKRNSHRIARDWGLHVFDMALAQGSILQLIDAETATWLRNHH